MCSSFSHHKMEKDQGDLADIVRASNGGSSASASSNKDKLVDWLAGNFIPSSDNFGDPFSNMHDPLLLNEQLDLSSFFDNNRSNNSSSLVKMMNIEENLISNNHHHHHHHLSTTFFDESSMIRSRPSNNNIFSRMLQISPNSKISSTTTTSSTCDMISSSSSSPRVVLATSSSSSSKTCCSSSSIEKNVLIKSTNNPNTTGCSIESVGMMQISSPRNPASIKQRRKSQAKKVVCIPAPAAANSSRPSSGEVVPSDLWAWRKYGQKPIKGSPYPRGYYRCSSSKGCSARKQVERSRTDPNMLVITYTSEHNHPWPTQRNALAGSTRSQPPKNNNNNNAAAAAAASKNSSTSISSQTSAAMKLIMNVKEEIIQENVISIVDGSINVMNPNSSIKEEAIDHMSSDDHLNIFNHDQNYKPAEVAASELLFDSNLHPDDFFSDLGELEYDPLNLLFTEEFINGKFDQEGRSQNKTLDPFSLFDWAGNNSMFGENKRA